MFRACPKICNLRQESPFAEIDTHMGLSAKTRYIESNTGKSARHPRVSEISLSCTFYRCLILFVTLISSCVLFDSYVLLADDHVNNVSYFPFMSIKKVIPYFCVLREGYYVIIWLIVRICVYIKDWKLKYSELFILKRKSMENSGGSWHKQYSMHLPVKRTWFFCLVLVQDKKISHRWK